MSRSAAFACACALLASMATASASRHRDLADIIAKRDIGLVAKQVAALPRQRPGIPDLYVIGVAGDDEVQLGMRDQSDQSAPS